MTSVLCLLLQALFAVYVMAEETTTTSAPAATSSPLTYADLAKLPLKERLLAYPWKLEKITLLFTVGYLVAYGIGSQLNKRKVDKFVGAIVPILKDNFFQVGVTKTRLLAKDDQQHYTLYASGRLRVEALIAQIELQARQNLFMWGAELTASFLMDSISTPQDKVTFDFQFDGAAAEQFDDFVWAVVNKEHMNVYRKENYFLSLTATSESDKLPVQYVFMNEVPQMNDVLYLKKLSSLLPKCSQFLEFLAITDQGFEKPDRLSLLKPHKRLVLQMRIPSSNAEVEAAQELLGFLLNEYIDYVTKKAVFRPELTRRCKKTRENEYNKLKRSLEEAKKEEQSEQKAKEEKEKRAKLSPAEQDKLAKRQNERRQRRAMNRQKVRT